MWTVKKIFNYDYESGDSYVLLARNSKHTKNKNTDLLRAWVIKTFPDVCKAKKDIPAVLKDKKLGRLTSWINGTSQSKAIEDVVIELMNEAGEKITTYKPPEEKTIIAKGWLPSILPVVSYDLKLKKCKNSENNKAILKIIGVHGASSSIYRITGVDWIDVGKLDGIKLIPFIDWFADKAASNQNKRCRDSVNGVTKSVSLKAFIKSRWRKADWSIITRENYKTKILRLVSDNVQHFLLYVDSYKPYLLRMFQSYFELPLKLMPWVKYKWLQIKTPRSYNREQINQLYVEKNVEIRKKWNRLATNPENILLQGEDYLHHMDINDYKRLCLCLERELPEDKQLQELQDANEFIKSLYNKTCLPIDNGERTSSTKYVHKVGNNWATVYDIQQTKKILDWLENIPVYVNKNMNKNIPFETQVVLKHPDDKMHWWSNYSYANVSLERTEDRYIIGNAHNFTHDDWIMFAQGPKPLAIVGRCDILGKGRGNIFYDYVTHRRKLLLFDSYPVCENIEKISYEDAQSQVWMNAQVYVSCKRDKETYLKFRPATKLKRKWMFNPKRIVTEELNDGVNIWVKESDGSDAAVFHSILKSAYSDANVICTGESYQMVDIAILICTDKTTPLDIHRVKSYARQKVILVEVEPAPIMRYAVKCEASLINIQ